MRYTLFPFLFGGSMTKMWEVGTNLFRVHTDDSKIHTELKNLRVAMPANWYYKNQRLSAWDIDFYSEKKKTVEKITGVKL